MKALAVIVLFTDATAEKPGGTLFETDNKTPVDEADGVVCPA